MSQIFDALLRSEADRTGKDAESHAVATEILQRVESLTASQWESADLHSKADVPAHLESLKAPSVETRNGSAPTAREEFAVAWERIKSLSLSPASTNRLVCVTEVESPTAEAFRLLSVRLRDLRRTQALRKVLITSTVPREGKSTVAANLACTLARETKEKVLLLEGDVRRPSLAQTFDLGRIPGLCECLQGKRSLQDSLCYLEEAGLWILPAGLAPTTPLDLLQSEKLRYLMDYLVSLFDWIIVDSPPILPLADTSVWIRMLDGVLLVSRQGVTEKKQLEQGIQALEPGKLIGALLNCSRVSAHSSYYYRISSGS